MPYEDEISPYGMLVEPSEEINQLAKRTIGVCIDVHRELGPGLPEEAYQKALAIEFDARGIRYEAQYRIVIHYKGFPVARVVLDFLVEGQLVLEVKSCASLTPIDRRQVLRYLEVTKLPLGLLANFNVMMLKDGIRRIVRSEAITE